MIKIDENKKVIFSDTDNMVVINRELKSENIKGLIKVDKNGLELKKGWSIDASLKSKKGSK